jgi:hypothetical protein
MALGAEEVVATVGKMARCDPLLLSLWNIGFAGGDAMIVDYNDMLPRRVSRHWDEGSRDRAGLASACSFNKSLESSNGLSESW